MNKEVGIVWHSSFASHLVPHGHPESFVRVEAILQALRQAELLQSRNEYIVHRKQSNAIRLCHTAKYIDYLEQFSAQLDASGSQMLATGDVYLSKQSVDVAQDAVATVLLGVELVMSQEVDSAFCVVRPPGHHAEPDRGMGFCIFSNVAIAAKYLTITKGLQRVAIVDWDVHHGNGTQACCLGNQNLLYISTHQEGIYPETLCPGLGQHSIENCLNFPIKGGAGSRERLLLVFEEKVLPALIAFEPEFILLSCGFDAHYLDPLGGLELQNKDFATLTMMIRTVADRYAQGRIVSVLEGGYNLSALEESAVSHVRALFRTC